MLSSLFLGKLCFSFGNLYCLPTNTFFSICFFVNVSHDCIGHFLRHLAGEANASVPVRCGNSIQRLVGMVLGPEDTHCNPQDLFQVQIHLKVSKSELTAYHIKPVIGQNWIVLTGVLRIEYWNPTNERPGVGIPILVVLVEEVVECEGEE